MTVRTRFAPSPTGYLHIGGARTALFCYLFARNRGGKFILRIEDTDLARSKREYEEAMVADLKWLGIEFDEGPECGGAFGPYRQSERLEIYNRFAQELIRKNQAYYCFCSEEELKNKKEMAESEGLAPHYDGKCRNISYEVAKARLMGGEKATVRFKAVQKSFAFHDLVRGRVEFPEGMVGDFVVLRSDGVPVYNYCCVVDDWQMEITHVIRAEEHLPNTLRQLMLYEALEAKIPEFAHVSLLIGKDRQKLSKRHGAVAVSTYREETYLPQAMVNYLGLLGWTHPDEKEIFDINEMIRLFGIDRLSKSPAIFDVEKFHWVNGQHLRLLDNKELVEKIRPFIQQDHPFHQQSKEWKEKCLDLFKHHIVFFKEIMTPLNSLFQKNVILTDELKEILDWESTPKLANYLFEQLKSIESDFVTVESFDKWSEYIKKELKIKGKPLFMGIRGVLTGSAQGPDLKYIVPLTSTEILKDRVQQIVSYYHES